MSWIECLEKEYLDYTDNDTANELRDRVQKLPTTERRQLLIFLELGSRRRFAEYFNISHSKANYLIKNILTKLKC